MSIGIACFLIVVLPAIAALIVVIFILSSISSFIIKRIKHNKQKNINPETTNVSLDEKRKSVVNYIISCRNTGTMGDEVIYANLKNVGWNDTDIETAFKLSGNKM